MIPEACKIGIMEWRNIRMQNYWMIGDMANGIISKFHHSIIHWLEKIRWSL